MSEEINELKMDENGITDDDKLWGALCFAISIVGLVVLLADKNRKDRPFIRHHAVLGLMASVAIYVVTFVLGFIPIVNCVAGLVGLGVSIYLIYLAITEAYNGRYIQLPYLNDFAKEQGWI